MNNQRHFISKIAPLAIIAVVIFLASTFSTLAAPFWENDAEKVISDQLKKIGVEDGTIGGFYVWGLGKITDCFADMDEALEGVTGKEYDMAGAFEDTVDSTLEDFADVKSEEDAFDKLGEIIGEVE